MIKLLIVKIVVAIKTFLTEKPRKLARVKLNIISSHRNDPVLCDL